jgi:lysophospholipase L1-like esterase
MKSTMKVNFLGDSITYGAGAGGVENSYVSVFERITGYEVRRYGVSGTRIAKQRTPSPFAAWDEDFPLRALAMDKDADFVFVFGGTNDYGHGDAPLGSFEDKDPYTFYGGLHRLFEYLVGVYGVGKLCFITPLPRFAEEDPKGENGEKPNAVAPLSRYVEIIREVATHYGVPLLDLYAEQFFPRPTTNTGDEYTTDGLHPNAKGHAMLAERIAQYLQERMALES